MVYPGCQNHWNCPYDLYTKHTVCSLTKWVSTHQPLLNGEMNRIKGSHSHITTSKYACHCPETQASWRSKASMIKTWNILHQRATPLKTQINNHSILGNKLADLLSFFKCVTATKTVGSKWITQASLWDIHYFTGKSCACSFDVSLRVFQGTFMSQREVDFYMKVTLKVETFTDGFLFSLPLKMFSVMISFFIVLTHCILFHCKIHASTFNCI